MTGAQAFLKVDRFFSDSLRNSDPVQPERKTIVQSKSLILTLIHSPPSMVYNVIYLFFVVSLIRSYAGEIIEVNSMEQY